MLSNANLANGLAKIAKIAKINPIKKKMLSMLANQYSVLLQSSGMK